MANLTATNLDDRVIQALQERAAKRGPSTEAEHRAILEAALAPPREAPAKAPLAAVLATIPDVGEDADFERVDR